MDTGELQISPRKFYKTIIQVVVLSEETAWSGETLDDLYLAITDGDCVGRWTTLSSEELAGPAIVKELDRLGSEAAFFGLNSDGSDLNRDEGVDYAEDGCPF